MRHQTTYIMHQHELRLKSTVLATMVGMFVGKKKKSLDLCLFLVVLSLIGKLLSVHHHLCLTHTQGAHT